MNSKTEKIKKQVDVELQKMEDERLRLKSQITDLESSAGIAKDLLAKLAVVIEPLTYDKYVCPQ